MTNLQMVLDAILADSKPRKPIGYLIKQKVNGRHTYWRGSRLTTDIRLAYVYNYMAVKHEFSETIAMFKSKGKIQVVLVPVFEGGELCKNPKA